MEKRRDCTDCLGGRERFVYEDSEIEKGGFSSRLVFDIDKYSGGEGRFDL